MRLLALLIFAGVFVAGLSAQQKFDPRDLSGHWDRTSPIVSFSNVPGSGRGATLEAPFTPEGKKMNDANKPGYGPRRGTTRNDPLGRCEPLGLARHLSTEIVEPHNTFEIVQLPNRILQFFEYRHDWREIWMDGRALPDPATVDPKWNGFSVGRWEGDTLVVDSIAFDGRSWVDKFGYPHSEEMRLQERYRRVDADTLELVMTITDPVVYSKPWSSDVKRMKLNREKAKRWDEQIYCVPSEEFPFQRLIQSGNVIEP
jgi:hypothetical protein